MSKESQDWFSIQAKFTATNTEELYNFFQSASSELLEEADAAYDLCGGLELAIDMLNNIGVNTDAKNQ